MPLSQAPILIVRGDAQTANALATKIADAPRGDVVYAANRLETFQHRENVRRAPKKP
jgi:hypothetical protein